MGTLLLTRIILRKNIDKTMKKINKLIIILAIFIALILTCKAENDNDGYTSIEDEDENTIQKTNSLENGQFRDESRQGKILFPYPLKYNSSQKYNENEQTNNGPRERRMLSWSYPQSPIADMMMQSFAVNYVPIHAADPFDFLRDSYPLPKGYSQVLDVYDYVIVGGGSAGSVLAARLSEDKPRAMVLLIEAGKPEMLLSDVPALVSDMQLTDYAWPYTMEHQPGVCMGIENQRCFFTRGKALGGTSVINYMMYSRGRSGEWNRIAADGNYGWSYEEVLQYYKKSERVELKKYRNSPHHGHDGELTVENVSFKTTLVEAFLGAARSFGNPTVDYCAPDGQLGFGYVQLTSNKGHRLSTAKAFLHPHKRRTNLHILTEALATKILIEQQSKRAYGVEYYKNNIKYTVRCRREIIVSAGPIGSPKLLMLSGVGPQLHLQSLGIPVIQDLNVGRNLYDEIGFPGVVFRLNTENASLIESKVATLPNLIQWMHYGDGLLTSPALIEALGYIKTSASDDTGPVPDIKLTNLGGSIASDSGRVFRKSVKIAEKVYNSAFASLHGSDTWSVFPVLLHPKSKGYLELRDANPFSPPKIYGNYYTHPNDLVAMKEAIKYIIKLGESEAFRKFGPRLHLAQYPSCVTHVPGSELYWECALKTLVTSVHLQMGTCKMGPPNDPEAVVDPELRVYGVEGLRVVDSSIIPRPIAGYEDSTDIMIGEKAADMIKKTWLNVIT